MPNRVLSAGINNGQSPDLNLAGGTEDHCYASKVHVCVHAIVVGLVATSLDSTPI